MAAFRGIQFHRGRRRWNPRVTCGGKTYSLGYYMMPATAARVYDCAVRLLRGGGEYNFDGQPPADVPEERIREMLVEKGLLARKT